MKSIGRRNRRRQRIEDGEVKWKGEDIGDQRKGGRRRIVKGWRIGRRRMGERGDSNVRRRMLEEDGG